jgi:hypothetical protein
MRSIDLLAYYTEQPGIHTFAQKFCDAIGLPGYEERRSSDYAGGRYLFSEIGRLSFFIARSANERHPDLPYWIHIESEQDEPELAIAFEEIAFNRLRPIGFKVARLENFGRSNERRIDY